MFYPPLSPFGYCANWKNIFSIRNVYLKVSAAAIYWFWKNTTLLKQRKTRKKLLISHLCRCFYGPTISVHNKIVGYFIDVNKFWINLKNNNKVNHNNHQLMWSESKTRCNRNVLEFFFHSNALRWYTLKRNTIHMTDNNNYNNNKNRARRGWLRWRQQ